MQGSRLDTVAALKEQLDHSGEAFLSTTSGTESPSTVSSTLKIECATSSNLLAGVGYIKAENHMLKERVQGTNSE